MQKTDTVGAVVAVMRTEGAIYGTVLAITLIAVGWDKDTDLEVLLFLLGSVTVFWVAHLYAGTIARLPSTGPSTGPSTEPSARTVLAAIGDTARHSIGMLAAMIVPALFLALGPLGLVEEYTAYYLALGSGVVILALLGYVMSARRGSSLVRRLLSTLTTTLLGVVVVWLSTLVH
ncbi:hypothetical protein Q0F99_12030 [Rathayibacter oskolensis]|uniref:hypothetical protein n=1 Tax=Rathayibacter TaxID=33886 RepID=UPI0013197EA1|nr:MULTISPECIES: hypothetical protein [Rathayibacter]QHC65751.1 hypothetical protein GSU68_03555 [Rathayibacter sp. VKM Ac-2759]WKK70580.1 hypothetical protein Q0F99_12030 [Rathayibacter oskolensis]